ncbi:endoplasmic reticulum aminopeptidase 2-like [Glandiceps talaboti]
MGYKDDEANRKKSSYEKILDSNDPAENRTSMALGLISVIIITLGITVFVVLIRPTDSSHSYNIRLPKTIVPETYHIFLHPNLTTEDFTGSVEIQILVKAKTSTISLHIKELSLTSKPIVQPVVQKRGEGTPLVDNTVYSEEVEMLHIGLTKSLLQGQRYTLTLNFTGKLSGGLYGFYKSHYKNEAGEDRLIATTQFEPTWARKAFPCFDEPAMKANFTMTMIRDKDHITLFNMPLTSSEPYEDTDLMMDKFDTTVKMSTYLVAFIVCDFDYKENITSSGVKVRGYAPPDKISQIPFAVEAGTEILTHYEKFFDIPYPLPKQDMVAIPDFAAGAMENWGLITFREAAILYEEGVSSSSDLQVVATVIAHELSHQWFGNLVTMEWWNDLWLNEGFASFVEYIGVDFIKPEWQMMDQFVYLCYQVAMTLDSLSNSHPISVTVTDPQQIDDIFDDISYEKGASVIRMLQDFLTNDVFMKGIKHYLETHAYGNADKDDLWAALTKADRENGGTTNMKEIMDTWILQMGYPFVTLTRNGNTVTATQQRFLIYPDGEQAGNESPFNYKWNIPFTYITSGDTETAIRLTLMSTSGEFTLPAETTWFKGNVKSTGFYRVNYDDNSWDVIIQQLQDDHTVFTSADRTSFIDDIFHLARANHVNQSKALDLSLYLTNEDDYVPIATAVSNLKYIGSVLQGRDGYEVCRQYILQLFDNIINKVGWEDTGTHIERLRRTLVLEMAVGFGQDTAVQKSVEKFNDWMNEGIGVSPDLKRIIYCSGIRNGNEDGFNYVWKKYQESTVASETQTLLYALSCTQYKDLLQRLLDWSIDPSKIRPQDTVDLIVTVANNPSNGGDLASEFIVNKLTTLRERYAGRDMGSIITGVVSGFKTPEELTKVEAFLAANPNVGVSSRTIEQAIEHIKMNIDWLTRYEDDVTGWFTNHVI